MPKRPIDPVRWTPPDAVSGRKVAPRELRVYATSGFGAEDVVVRDGHVLTGLADGRIVAIDAQTSAEKTVADTGGRPLGIELHPDGDLVVCDCRKGLLHVDPDGTVETLVRDFGGKPLLFCNNAAAASDGTIYFSDSSQRWNLEGRLGDVFEHRPTGRVFRRTPDGAVDLVVDGVALANGVALAPDESFLVVAQTTGYDVLRIDLTGASQGRAQRFGAALPGFPDNICTGEDGNIWITLVAPRVAAMDALLPRHPLLRKLLWHVPERLQPKAKAPIQIRVCAPDGMLLYDVDGTHPQFGNVTGVRPSGDLVWIASIEHAAIASFTVPAS